MKKLWASPAIGYRWSLSIALLGVLFGLSGCPNRSVLSKELLCKQSNGFNCLTAQGSGDVASASTASLPSHDINGAPLTVWKFIEKGQTVGILLTGESQHPFTSPLLHAFYFSMYAFLSPTDLLGAGYALVRNPGGAQTGPRYLQMLSDWVTVFQHLESAGWIHLRTIDNVRHKQRVQKIRADIQRFMNSPRSRTVLYYSDSAQGEPLLLPALTVSNRPMYSQARFSISLMPPARARALGRMYYLQQYENARPFWRALQPMLRKNLLAAQSINEIKFQCSHTWNKLFHVRGKKMSQDQFHLYREIRHRSNPNLRRREHCTQQTLSKFRRSKLVQKKVMSYRKQVDALNHSFQSLLETYNKAYNNIKMLRAANVSTFLDAFLRGQVLYFQDPIQVQGRVRFPQDLMKEWIGKSQSRIWKQIHKDFQNQGKHTRWSGQVGGLLHKPYTFFRVRRIGQNYLVRPYVLVGGSFAVIVARSRGVIEVVSTHQALPRGRSSARRKTVTGTGALARKQPRSLSSTKAFTKKKEAPYRTTRHAFYQRREDSRATLALARSPRTQQSPRRKSLKRRLLRLLSKPCAPNAPLSPIHNANVLELPTELPKLPKRSFRVYKDFFWMRFQCHILAVPLRGAGRVSRPVQVRIARRIERGMLQKDAIPLLVQIQSLQPLRLNIRF